MSEIEASLHNSYFLGGRHNRLARWVMMSLLLHVAFFSIAWVESRRIETPKLVHKKAVQVQTVKWGEKERPKHWMPRKEAAPVPEKKEAVKVAPNPQIKPKAVKPKPKVAQKTPKQLQRERKQRMARALSRVKHAADDKYGSPDGVRGAPSSKALQILGSVYAGRLREVFRSNWAIPTTIAEDELERLSCKILLKIDRTGGITTSKLMNSSGNAQFDSSAMRAVKTTSRVPLPDDMLQDIVFRDGILINFTRKD